MSTQPILKLLAEQNRELGADMWKLFYQTTAPERVEIMLVELQLNSYIRSYGSSQIQFRAGHVATKAWQFRMPLKGN